MTKNNFVQGFVKFLSIKHLRILLRMFNHCCLRTHGLELIQYLVCSRTYVDMKDILVRTVIDVNQHVMGNLFDATIPFKTPKIAFHINRFIESE